LARGGQRHVTKLEYRRENPENLPSWRELIAKSADLNGQLMTKKHRLNIGEQMGGLEHIHKSYGWSFPFSRHG